MNPMPEDPNADRALDALLAADVVPAPSPALRRGTRSSCASTR